MPHNLVKLALLVAIIIVAALVFQPKEKRQYSPQEMANISAAMNGAVDRAVEQARAKQKMTKPKENANPVATSSGKQSIIGAIYKKSNTTWFFKAKDSSERINLISPSFKNYFVDQMKFNADEQPILTHIPESMRAANTSSMRIATFMLECVEVSVSQLSGQQDVNANVVRWMDQLGIKNSEQVTLDYRDNKQTILVMMTQ
jgi:hypothetical protein